MVEQRMSERFGEVQIFKAVGRLEELQDSWKIGKTSRIWLRRVNNNSLTTKFKKLWAKVADYGNL